MHDKLAELLLILMVALGLLLARGILARHRRERHASPRPDPERHLLSLLALATLVGLPLLHFCSRWLEFAEFSFSDWRAWAGLAFGAAAIAWFCRTLYDSIRYRDSEHFEAGLFRYVRHPFYTGLLLWALAQLLLMQNWLLDLCAAGTFLAIYLLRVPREEQILLERHGHRYLDYMERTGALLPRWQHWRNR